MVFQVTPTNNRNALLSSIQNDTAGLAGLSQFNVSLLGDSRAFGTFAGDPFQLRSGIALSTGRVVDLPGINTVDGRDGGSGLSTDFGIIGAQGDTIQLQISFFADNSKDSLYFQYVFGSEEFREFAGTSFNDKFSLVLNGINYAVFPDGSLATINNLLSSSSDDGKDFYIDNPVNTGLASNLTRLDGYTKPLIFSAPLKKNSLNTLVIQVQDVSDGLLDSAVFIKAGTFGTTPLFDIDDPRALLPIAREDSYKTNEITPLIVDASKGVLTNDKNPVSATLNAALVSLPQNGSLTLNPDGSFRYVPNAGFTGIDRFSYKDITSAGESSPATVTIEVIPSLIPPVPPLPPTPPLPPIPPLPPTPTTDIIGTPGRDVLIGTNLAERIIGLQSGDILTGGGGRDQFIYQDIRDAGDRITDFTIGEDKIVLTGVLRSIGYYGLNPIADGIISFRQASSNLAILQIDPDGLNASGFKSVPFILLDNITISDFRNVDSFIF
jgi:Bacterial Ig domain